jgi:hypothetical protein
MLTAIAACNHLLLLVEVSGALASTTLVLGGFVLLISELSERTLTPESVLGGRRARLLTSSALFALHLICTQTL